jgi:hypothetical protein
MHSPDGLTMDPGKETTITWHFLPQSCFVSHACRCKTLGRWVQYSLRGSA